ncbi:hypothetical protein SANT12839_047760 [Streptomyces antimycoticus]|uniref:Uncharacterized protein n=1 Tax=Streptomyces antimycoticus TaxID=68175 RepID=A0A4D4K719_9ACTN|nr:hypothetical protein SANT12839_047760 [Streptomyces antimycoticus]
MQPVDRLGGDIDGGVEAEGVVGAGHVVVDRLGHSDHLDALAAQGRGDAERVLAADRDERVHLVLGEGLPHPADPVLAGQGIGPGGSEDGAAARQDAAHGRDVQRHDGSFEHAAPAVPHSDELEAVDLHALSDDAADRGVEPGAVTAAGQHTDTHLRSLRRRREPLPPLLLAPLVSPPLSPESTHL